jgi:hypothetical protein
MLTSARRTSVPRGPHIAMAAMVGHLCPLRSHPTHSSIADRSRCHNALRHIEFDHPWNHDHRLWLVSALKHCVTDGLGPSHEHSTGQMPPVPHDPAAAAVSADEKPGESSTRPRWRFRFGHSPLRQVQGVRPLTSEADISVDRTFEYEDRVVKFRDEKAVGAINAK